MKVKSCPSNGSEENADILAMLIKVFEIFSQALQAALNEEDGSTINYGDVYDACDSCFCSGAIQRVARRAN